MPPLSDAPAVRAARSCRTRFPPPLSRPWRRAHGTANRDHRSARRPRGGARRPVRPGAGTVPAARRRASRARPPRQRWRRAGPAPRREARPAPPARRGNALRNRARWRSRAWSRWLGPQARSRSPGRGADTGSSRSRGLIADLRVGWAPTPQLLSLPPGVGVGRAGGPWGLAGIFAAGVLLWILTMASVMSSALSP